MYTINPGEFKHPIEIQKFKNKGTNKENIPIEGWETVLNTKAKVANISGKEVIMADGINLMLTKRFTIRFPRNLEVNREDRLLYNNQIYNITYPNDVQEAHKYLEIVAELVV